MKTEIGCYYFEVLNNTILVSYVEDKDNVIEWIDNIDNIDEDKFLSICNEY